MSTHELQLSYSQEDITLMRETICKGCTPADFKLFLMVCQRTKLDPFAKQIYAVPRWDAKLGRNSMTVQTSIDGLRLVAERTGKYAPGRATTYEYDMEGKLISATAYVKKQTNDGTWHEVSHTAFFEEYCQRTRDGTPTKFWKDMARVMIAKVAEAACLRRCFPMELSGLYTTDEMQQAEVVEVPSVAPSEESAEEIKSKIEELLGYFSEEDHPFVEDYLNKWSKSHMKSIGETVGHFLKPNELAIFKERFHEWKEKQKKRE